MHGTWHHYDIILYRALLSVCAYSSTGRNIALYPGPAQLSAVISTQTVPQGEIHVSASEMCMRFTCIQILLTAVTAYQLNNPRVHKEKVICYQLEVRKEITYWHFNWMLFSSWWQLEHSTEKFFLSSFRLNAPIVIRMKRAFSWNVSKLFLSSSW